LCGVSLTRRPEPKVGAVRVRPSGLPAAADPGDGPGGASASAIRSHYDVSNSFYALWLGPSMMYSSAMWPGAGAGTDLQRAQQRKIDFFAARVLPGPGPWRGLDRGCGWGGTPPPPRPAPPGRPPPPVDRR